MEMDSNGDGSLSREELPQKMRGRFHYLDLNGDGKVDRDEIEQSVQRRIGKQTPGMI